MTLSLNEVEATTKRAVRGAGYSWGQAEEAGKAARWLCGLGLDGVGQMARFLQSAPTNGGEDRAADHGSSGPAGECPLSAGILVSDGAHQIPDAGLDLNTLTCPALILPFTANAALMLRDNVSVVIGKTHAVTDGVELSLSGPLPQNTGRVSVRRGGVLANTVPRRTRATPDSADWAVLTRFAHQTYAPATEDSRLRGAGAGLSDND